MQLRVTGTFCKAIPQSINIILINGVPFVTSLYRRELLREVKLSGCNHIVLEVNRDNIYNVLKQAQQIGLMTSYHHYFVTSLVSR